MKSKQILERDPSSLVSEPDQSFLIRIKSETSE